MPGDRKHHTEKFRSCVEQVIASGKSEDSAYAICTASLQDAGEPIFEGAEMHQLHLLGATGQTRTEMLDGKEYLVVPVVALMEGVIHAVNAETPEFVPLATLKRAAATWNGRPVVIGHPTKNGRQCSANAPEVLTTYGIGTIFNSRVEGIKLLQEAWVEKAKAKKLHPELYANLEASKTEEVSVGAFVVTDDRAGAHNGKAYRASWLETTGDHLAFLPGGRGACSVEMGCGTHRAAMRVCGDHMELEVTRVLVFTALEEKSLDDRIAAVNRAVDKKWGGGLSSVQPVSYAYAQQVFDDRVIVRKDQDLFSVPYTVGKDGEVEFGEPTKVRQEYVAAAAYKEDCPTCRGSGNKDGNPCEVCDGSGEMAVEKKKKTRAAADTRLQPGDIVHNLVSSNGERKSLKVYSVKEHLTNPFLYRIAFEGGSPRDSWVDKSNTYTVTRGDEQFSIRASMSSMIGMIEKRH